MLKVRRIRLTFLPRIPRAENCNRESAIPGHVVGAVREPPASGIVAPRSIGGYLHRAVILAVRKQPAPPDESQGRRAGPALRLWPSYNDFAPDKALALARPIYVNYVKLPPRNWASEKPTYGTDQDGYLAHPFCGGKMNREQIKQRAILVLGDAARSFSSCFDYVYDIELPGLQEAVEKIKSLKDAAVARKQQESSR